MKRVTTNTGRARIEGREARRNRAYRDIKGNWTIGVGHTSMAGTPVVGPGLYITDAQMDLILARDLKQFEAAVNRHVTVPLADHQFDACVSVAFNAGGGGFHASRFCRLLNLGPGAAEAAAKALVEDAEPALRGRRQDEARQFLTPYHEEPVLIARAPLPPARPAPVLRAIARLDVPGPAGTAPVITPPIEPADEAAYRAALTNAATAATVEPAAPAIHASLLGEIVSLIATRFLRARSSRKVIP